MSTSPLLKIYMARFKEANDNIISEVVRYNNQMNTLQAQLVQHEKNYINKRRNYIDHSNMMEQTYNHIEQLTQQHQAAIVNLQEASIQVLQSVKNREEYLVHKAQSISFTCCVCFQVTPTSISDQTCPLHHAEKYCSHCAVQVTDKDGNFQCPICRDVYMRPDVITLDAPIQTAADPTDLDMDAFDEVQADQIYNPPPSDSESMISNYSDEPDSDSDSDFEPVWEEEDE